MPGKLVRTSSQPLEDRFDPQVLTKADPDPEWLIQARADMNRDEALQKVLLECLEEGRTPEGTADAVGSYLAGQWGGHEDDAYEAALYLVDEYRQLGEGIHLVSTETGRVLITLDEEKDLWQPPDLPREGSSGLAKPLKRIRPDLEALITTLTFDKAREEKIVRKLVKKGRKIALAQDMADPSLLVATRAGRRRIVRGLVDFDPIDLLRAVGGTSGAFLRHWHLTTDEAPLGHLEPLQGTATARSVMGVQDQTTVNLHHNRAATLQGALTQGWVREIARSLAEERKDRAEKSGNFTCIPMGDLTSSHFGQTKFWVAPPELVAVIRQVQPDCTVLPVDRSPVIGFTKPEVGHLVVPTEFLAENLERSDKWTVATHLEYNLWVDWDSIMYLPVEGIEYQAQVV